MEGVTYVPTFVTIKFPNCPPAPSWNRRVESSPTSLTSIVAVDRSMWSKNNAFQIYTTNDRQKKGGDIETYVNDYMKKRVHYDQNTHYRSMRSKNIAF